MSYTTAASRRARRGFRAALVVAVIAAFGVLASPAWAGHGNGTPEVPAVFNPNPNNNCNGTNQFKHDSDQSGTLNGTFNGSGGPIPFSIQITVTSGDVTFVVTSGNVNVQNAQIKGGTDANDYSYAPGGIQHDDGLTAPGVAAMSHVCFTLGEGGGGLAATFTSISAKRTATGVSLRWRTASELDVLGFNAYIERNGKRVKLNRSLIMSKGASGGSYSFSARVPKAKKGLRMWLEVVNLDGSRTLRVVRLT